MAHGKDEVEHYCPKVKHVALVASRYLLVFLTGCVQSDFHSFAHTECAPKLQHVCLDDI